jgi:hypothetical protein
MVVVDLIRATLTGVAGSALAVVPVGGCLGGCPEDERFDEDRVILAKDVDELIADQGVPSSEDLTCEDLCWHVVHSSGGDSLKLDSCTFDIDGYTEPSSTDTDNRFTQVGRVQCAGVLEPECIGGRRPLGHVEALALTGDALGRSFAGFAYLERASVVAFLQLRRQLSAWCAPQELIERCEAAARDEVRHAAIMTRFARRHGARVPTMRCSPCDSDLLSAAIHNAVEGCVVEAWAALLAHVQAARARDREVRAAYAAIADDETRHAQLAWDLHRWFSNVLPASDRKAVLAAQRHAISALPMTARAQAHRLPSALGVPNADLTARLAHDFGQRLAAA